MLHRHRRIYGAASGRETILVGTHEIVRVNVMINSIYQDFLQYFPSCVEKIYWVKYRNVFAVFFPRFCNCISFALFHLSGKTLLLKHSLYMAVT